MKNLNEMTSKELKEIAKELHIANWWTLRKEVLIEKIEEATAEADEEEIEDEDQDEESIALAQYRTGWAKYTKKWLSADEFIKLFRENEIILNEDGELEVLNDELMLSTSKVDEEDQNEESADPEENDEDDEDEEEETETLKPKRGALIEFDGKAQNICAWGRELGISPNTLYGRLYKMGWTVERAFTTKK